MLSYFASAFFRCPACGASADLAALPYCEPCIGSLVSAHPSDSNLGPEIDPDDGLSSLSAVYSLVGPGYEVLKAWKSRSSPLADRKIFARKVSIPEEARRAAAIVPIPQNRSRSWALGRSPALQIAQWLSCETRLPVLSPLRLEDPGRAPKQATLDLPGRLLRPVRIRADAFSFEPLLGQKIILVDDFVTTGRTLREGARACLRAGAAEVHGFALGIRYSKLSRSR